MMRVACVSLHFAEYAYRLARALADGDCDVLLVVDEVNFKSELGILPSDLSRDRLRIVPIANRGLADWRLFAEARRLVGCVRGFAPDVIHCQESAKDVLALALPFLRRFPLVLTIHDHVPHSGTASNLEIWRKRTVLFRRLLRRRATAAIVHGDRIRAASEAIMPWLAGRIFKVPHGPLGEPQADLNRDWQDGCLLFFGRVEEYKGLRYLLRSIELLKARNRPVHAVIAGRGPDLPRYRDKLNELGVEVIEKFIPRHEVTALFHRASLVVLPYTDATQSGIVSLAFNYGRPVVATDVGSIGEVVEDGVNGLLVPPRDPEAFAKAIERLLSDSSRMRSMAEANRDAAEGALAWPTLARQTMTVYAAATGGGGSETSRSTGEVEPEAGRGSRAGTDAGADPERRGRARAAGGGRKAGVLMVAPSLMRAGAETQAVDLINGLPTDEFDKHIVTFGAQLDQRSRLNGSEVNDYNFKRRFKLDPEPSRSISRLIDEHKIDVVVCSQRISLLVGGIAVQLSNRRPPLVASLHSTVHRGSKYRLYDQFLYSQFLRRCAQVVCVCRHQEREWVEAFGVLRGRTTVIHNGVDTAHFDGVAWADRRAAVRDELGLPQDAVVACTVAGMRPVKGHLVLLDAFRSVLETNPDAWLVLVGDGRLRPEVKAAIARYRIGGRVRLVGARADVRPMLAAADFLVIPSFTEVFSMAMLEAMAMGLPVLATDVGGTGEAVVDGVTGLLVPPKQPAAIAAGIAKMIEHPEARREMGTRGYHRVRDLFTREAMIAKATTVLKAAAGRPPETPRRSDRYLSDNVHVPAEPAYASRTAAPRKRHTRDG